MALIHLSSPHLTGINKTAHVMRLVILATLPGLAMLTWFFGWGNLINVIWCGFIAVISEALIIKLRAQPISFYLSDYSALLTGVLLGLALPPLAPWWLTLIATSFAIIVAKQLYGGMGQNPFNPAMVGYALVLISCPVQMTSWLAPQTLTAPADAISFTDTLMLIFGVGGIESIDALTMATPLDTFKHKGAVLAEDLWASAPILSPRSWQAWQLISLGYLLGGLFLIYRKIFSWHTPLSMLVTLGLVSAFFWLGDPSNYASPQMHLLGGATMLGAFFIATDPATSATSVKGKLYYGACMGLLVYLIRTWGNYPDAVAFSVLLMNFSAPFIDYYTQPRTYGHPRR